MASDASVASDGSFTWPPTCMASGRTTIVAARVAAARALQRERYRELGLDHVGSNAAAPASIVEAMAAPDASAAGLLRDAAERNDGAELRHFGDCPAEKIAAGGDFLRGRLVLGRHAADRIGDTRVAHRDAIIRMGFVNALREAEFSQRLVQQPAGVVAGERPSCAICTFEPWRKADDQQLCDVIAKRWNWRIKPFRVRRSLDLTERGQTRTERTVP